MKPTNYNNSGCDPISSNCVIWQGPDIECINLCKGDSVSEVVNKLATELCNLLDSLKISVYDLSCLNLGDCQPDDFKALVQLLIDKVCEDQGVVQTESSGGCPDCVVNICPEFYYTNPTGDQVTTMQLKDYVLAIGNKVCTITGQITTINNTLSSHNTRIEALEQAGAPTVTLPTVDSGCLIEPTGQYDLDEVLDAITVQFCELRTFTGDTQKITAAIQAVCVGLGQSDQLNGQGTMSQVTGWIANPTSMADTMVNMWKTICDMRGAVNYILNTCCNTTCSGIGLIVNGELTDPSTLVLTFGGIVPGNFTDQGIGSTIEISESGGGLPQVENQVFIEASYYTPSQPLTIPLTTVNGANDLTIKTTYRFQDTAQGLSCENTVTTIVLGTDTCPSLVINSDYFSLDWNFTWNGTVGTLVTVNLYNASLQIVQSIPVVTVAGVNNGSFTSLAEGTTYNIALDITGVGECPANQIDTLTYPCNKPTLLAPTIALVSPEGDQDGGTIESWVATYDIAHP